MFASDPVVRQAGRFAAALGARLCPIHSLDTFCCEGDERWGTRSH
jgi:hypothetical protein